jgi:hypothetical protein
MFLASNITVQEYQLVDIHTVQVLVITGSYVKNHKGHIGIASFQNFLVITILANIGHPFISFISIHSVIINDQSCLQALPDTGNRVFHKTGKYVRPVIRKKCIWCILPKACQD